jgi:hypothetical protein
LHNKRAEVRSTVKIAILMMKLQLLTSEYLPYYLQKQPYNLQKYFNRFVKKSGNDERF